MASPLKFYLSDKCVVGSEPCVIFYIMTFIVCARFLSFLTSASFALEKTAFLTSASVVLYSSRYVGA